MPKLDYRQIAIAYGMGTLTSVTTGLVAGYLWQHLGGEPDYTLTIGGAWLTVVGVPSLLVSGETLRRTLGQQPRPTISAIPGTPRLIPWSGSNKTGHVFVSSVKSLWPTPPAANPPPMMLPNLFLVENLCLPGSDTPCDVQLTEAQVSDFLYGVWRRQLQWKAPFSRPYWLNHRRPRLEKPAYYALLKLLLDNNLIINRRSGKSGRLILSPPRALRHLQWVYQLQH